MNFLERMFGKERSASAAPVVGASALRQQQIPAAYKAYVEELTAIGNREAFLAFKPGGKYNAQCRHIRAREIGMRLNMEGGSILMRKIFDRVDCRNVRQLAAAWDGIGDWAA